MPRSCTARSAGARPGIYASFTSITLGTDRLVAGVIQAHEGAETEGLSCHSILTRYFSPQEYAPRLWL